MFCTTREVVRSSDLYERQDRGDACTGDTAATRDLQTSAGVLGDVCTGGSVLQDLQDSTGVLCTFGEQASDVCKSGASSDC